MSLQEVSEFFSAYNAAFDALDGEAVAVLWHSPSGIWSGAEMAWWPEHDSIQNNMVALCELYRAAGYVRATHRIADHISMGADAAFVNVAWTIECQKGRVLQSFNTGYNLQRFAGQTQPVIRVVLCTAYEENLSEIRANAAH